MKKIVLCLLATFSIFAEKVDIVIPVHKKDSYTLDLILDAVEKYFPDQGNVYIISRRPYTTRAVWIDEEDYPFSLDDCSAEIGGKGGVGTHQRRGWYYQQMLKFYAHTVIENLSEHFLILDADTLAQREIRLITDDGKPYINVRRDRPSIPRYYQHMQRVFPDFEVIDRKTNPVVNHMVFSQSVLNEMFEKTEERHGKPFWKVFLNKVDLGKALNTRGFQVGASEYLIYYHYCINYYPNDIHIKPILIFNRAKSFTDNKLKYEYDFITRHIQHGREDR